MSKYVITVEADLAAMSVAPVRHFDYYAHFGDMDEGVVRGRGATHEDAVLDLINNYDWPGDIA